MKIIIVDNIDRKKVMFNYLANRSVRLTFCEELFEKNKIFFEKDIEFELYCYQKYQNNSNESYTFYKKCKVIEFQNQSITFIFDSTKNITGKMILPMIRKNKLEKINLTV